MVELRNEAAVFKNGDLDLEMRIILNDDGSISVNAEDVAIGLGWSKTEVKNGKEYTSIRWDRMNAFSAECGFPQKWSKDDYIPESLFYMLAMKANNDRAQNIKLDIAKEMAMLERNQKGKQVRRYFIQVEKKYKTDLIEQLNECNFALI